MIPSPSRFALALAILCLLPNLAARAETPSRQEIDLAGPGWKVVRDPQADWRNEPLYLPDTPMSAIAVHPPSNGWPVSKLSGAIGASVPATSEEYFHQDLDLSKIVKPRRPNSPLEGVTWWSRTIQIPAVASQHRFVLRFGSVRLRAEVFVNQKLAGYDLVGDTPFSVDITDAVSPGQSAELAIRVTNPGGCLDWTDTEQIKWGSHILPDGRSFSGITGSVTLQVLNPVYIDDLWVINTPAPGVVNASVDIENTDPRPMTRDLVFDVSDSESPGTPAFEKAVSGLTFAPGASSYSLKIAVPSAKTWSPVSPHLYVCRARVRAAGKEEDVAERPFGFRWFTLDGLGQDALLRLNGERIFLLTAISWGYWPVTGLIPTPAIAEKQIKTAKLLGLNMLNFHRCIGSPVVLNEADRQGLLYFEEPGGYVTGGADPFAQTLAREKLLRMVKRDRSHPSLIIYNMINEQWDAFGADKQPAVFAVAERDMRDAHAIDPSRLIVYSSAWARKDFGADEPQKLHMRPYDDAQYQHGWWDYHRAGGPKTYEESTYTDPQHHYGFSANKGEIVYRGEEGAISSPPRLALIKKDIDASGNPGWDGAIYLDWHSKFSSFMDRKNLHPEFGSLDAFTLALGAVSMEHQGRKIEDMRICDVNDGYAINGWEAMVFDNHSGVVDCYRNPKGDPALIARYAQPLYVAVKLRHQFAEPGGSILGDFYLLNEKNLHGAFNLHLEVSAPDGTKLLEREKTVTVRGGDVFSELLMEGVALPAAAGAGFCQVRASLIDQAGSEAAGGGDQFLTVSWKNAHMPTEGAVYETEHGVKDFLAENANLAVPAFDDSQGQLRWLLVARSPREELRGVPPDNLTDGLGHGGQLVTTFYRDASFRDVLAKRSDKGVAFTSTAGAAPDPSVSQIQDYGVRWEGEIVPSHSGACRVALKNNHEARLFIHGKLLIENKVVRGVAQKEATLDLTEGTPIPFRVEYLRGQGDAAMQMLWLPPGLQKLDPSRLLERAKLGTTLILADHAEDWMDMVKAATGIGYTGAFKVGDVWLGGQFFVRANPLFRDLPVNCALNWPYQAVVDDHRIGFKIEGEELVAGCWQSTGCQLGTAVGIIPYGKGRIIFSTLNIVPKLHQADPPSLVARKLLTNYIACP